jgi:hypothetical protein
MGKLVNGINGPFVGTIGTVVGSSWNGIPYTKGRYKKRTKKISKKEVGNRGKFGDSQAWLRPLLDFVRVGFNGYTKTVKGFIAAKSYLSKHAFEGELPNVRINPALMKVSFGDLPLSPNIAVAPVADSYLQFTWDTTPVHGGSPKDQIMMLAYDIENALAMYTTTGQFRDMGVDRLRIDMAAGKTYHIYAAFSADDRKSQSHSMYLGEMSF